MEEPQFDRQAFISTPQEPPPRPSFPMGGALLLLVALAGAGFVFYRIRNPASPGDNETQAPSLTKIEKHLDEIDKRLDRLEKRRRALDTSSPAEAKDPPHLGEVHQNSQPQAPTVASAMKPKTPPASSTDAAAAHNDPHKLPNAPLGTLESEIAATHEEWSATADRLGSVVGELGNQHARISQNQQSLNELLSRLDRVALPFKLQKGKKSRMQVGPTWLWLQGTDRSKGRYTVNLFVDDRWVQFKDRVLNEVVEINVPGGRSPLELVVSQIGDGIVSGDLSVPKAATTSQADLHSN